MDSPTPTTEAAAPPASSSGEPGGPRTKYGFPPGYRFAPKNHEILALLAARLNRQRLPDPLPSIFHDLCILNHHPRVLYDRFIKEHEEHGGIYFFSRREFPGGAGPADGDKKTNPRPVRACRGGGGWKPSGGARLVTAKKKNGVSVMAGKMVTLVFYERRRADEAKPFKTNWGIHEFTLKQGPGDKFSEMAVYRLYKLKNKETMQEEAQQQQGQDHANGYQNHHAAAVPGDSQHATSSAVASTTQRQAGALAPNQGLVIASTSQTQQQQQQLSAGRHAQQYQHQYPHPYALGAAATPGPSNWAPPPAAAKPQAHQAPAMPVVHGAGHYASSSVSPASSSSPPPAATSPPPAPEQHAAATAPPPAQISKWEYAPMEQAMPPPPELVAPAAFEDDMADDRKHSWCGMLGLSADAGLGPLDDLMLDVPFDDMFTMEELMRSPPATPTPMHEDSPSGGGDDYNQAASGKQQEPPAILA